MAPLWTFLSVLAFLSMYLYGTKKYRWFYILTKTFRRDLRGCAVFLKVMVLLQLAKIRNDTVITFFESNVKRHPEKAAILYEDETWTFSALDKFSNKVARYFRMEGYQKGDSVGLLLENKPEFVAIWLGLSKIGVITALINTNLKNGPLIHSITAGKCKGLIFGASFTNVIEEVSEELAFKKLYQLSESNVPTPTNTNPYTNLLSQLEEVSNSSLQNEKPVLLFTDPILYIYTSGTTGLPKAALVTSSRYFFATWALYFALGLTPEDALYTPLPLYHTAGGILGIGQALVCGVTVAIRKKFSASNFWKDCAKYNCTAAQYIGEICRYILIAHKNVEPVSHPVRAIIGNGLKPQIWKQFVDKFKIKEVYEIYGSTEGITNLANLNGPVGAVGFIPWYARWAYPVTLIKCDETSGKIIRNKNGYCIECDINEPGLLIGKINLGRAILNFQGYADKKATEKKIIHNVFSPGDAYFNSGDVLTIDELGYFYFKDRTGDTFRWKGENVSTTEVETVISNATNFADTVVFGVELPHSEGRAGMAAIVNINSTLDLDLLSNALKKNLPSYAIPLFIRIVKSVPVTGTFKLKKIELQAVGYNINIVNDDIFFLDQKSKLYTPLTKDIYDSITDGSLHL